MSFTIKGTGSSYPKRVVTNDDLASVVDTSDEWIRTRTGISERRICTDETLSDLVFEAGKAALEDAGLKADEIDLIICSTIRADTITPSMACILQERLRATCPAFDINAACSGFIYAMDVAIGYFARGKAKNILIVSAEAMSKLVDWTDRATCVLFGDGAGAVLLSEGEDLLSIKTTATGRDLLFIPNVEGNSPFSEQVESEPYLAMKGQEVFKFAVNAICDDLKDVIHEAGFQESDIAHVLLHQANQRITNTAKKCLKIDPDKYHENIDRFGNTSSATIPVILDEINKAGKLSNGDLLAMSAFGGGLTTGACVIRWNK